MSDFNYITESRWFFHSKPNTIKMKGDCIPDGKLQVAYLGFACHMMQNKRAFEDLRPDMIEKKMTVTETLN